MKTNLLTEIHKILGPLSRDELAALKRSVEKNGVLVPVVEKERKQ